MAESYPRLYQGLLPTTEGTWYTVPNGWKVIIKEVIVCNVTNANATVTMSVVPNGGTASAPNRILAGKVVPAADIIILALSTGMNSGDTITAFCSVANALTITISGILYF